MLLKKKLIKVEVLYFVKKDDKNRIIIKWIIKWITKWKIWHPREKLNGMEWCRTEMMLKLNWNKIMPPTRANSKNNGTEFSPRSAAHAFRDFSATSHAHRSTLSSREWFIYPMRGSGWSIYINRNCVIKPKAISSAEITACLLN